MLAAPATTAVPNRPKSVTPRVDPDHVYAATIIALIERRRDLDISQIELNDRVGLQDGLLAKYECGVRRPTLRTLTYWAAALGLALFPAPIAPTHLTVFAGDWPAAARTHLTLGRHESEAKQARRRALRRARNKRRREAHRAASLPSHGDDEADTAKTTATRQARRPDLSAPPIENDPPIPQGPGSTPSNSLSVPGRRPAPAPGSQEARGPVAARCVVTKGNSVVADATTKRAGDCKCTNGSAGTKPGARASNQVGGCAYGVQSEVQIHQVIDGKSQSTSDPVLIKAVFSPDQGRLSPHPGSAHPLGEGRGRGVSPPHRKTKGRLCGKGCGAAGQQGGRHG